MDTAPTIINAPVKNSADTELRVSGMTCNNCARHVTEAIQGVAGVQSAAVSLLQSGASVRWHSAETKNVSAVLAAVSKAGYEASVIVTSAPAVPENHWQWTLIVSLAVTAFLMVGEWVFQLAMTPWFRWLAFALSGVVQVFCGAQFYRGAWRQLKIGSSNMDTLVALGSTTAFGYSTWALFSDVGGHVYFMEAAAIISLISAGHWVEARVSNQASGALKSLLNLAPQTAKKVQSPKSKVQNSAAQPFNLKSLSFSNSAIRNPQSAIEVEVPVSSLKIGDRIALRPGDRVPVDGSVIEGESAVDEAMLTGESVPADKKSGSALFAGTVNVNGRLVMRVTATGEATALAHIIAAVQRAQTSRADIQRLGDRISSVFVPIIVVIALAAGIFWATHSGAEKAFVIAAGVLIVACPCAMGLATPAAIMAAANAAARRGILIRDGVALEKAGTITAVIFDKTGTITAGKPEVASMVVVSPHLYPYPLPSGEGTATIATHESVAPTSVIALKQILPLPTGEGQGEGNAVAQIAATLARNSTHPISQAIAKLSSDALAVSDWKEIRGCGVEAKSAIHYPQSAILRLGSLQWLQASGVDLTVGEKFVAEWSAQGATLVGLASDASVLGLFAVRDAMKTKAAQVIAQLQRQGFKTFLLTGDNARTAASIAKQVGIAAHNIFAEVRPEQKAEFVKRLQAAAERVAFVGDGINDAPALTQADLGIAVSRASDIAREAADIILLKSEIEAVPEALGLARATLRTIKQNLFWAFFYNALGVPLAACGIISPIFCAAAMGFSDLIVIGNALRLLRWRK